MGGFLDEGLLYLSDFDMKTNTLLIAVIIEFINKKRHTCLPLSLY